MEDILNKKTTTFGKHEDIIQTLLYDKLTESLFAGDCRGHIIQYKRGSSDHSFSLVKEYGYTGIEAAYSSAQVGAFAFFGGQNHSVIAINIQDKRLCENKIKSPFCKTGFLQVCHGLDQKVYLSLGGMTPEYSSTVSDFLEVTEIYNYKKEFSVLNEKQMQPKKEEEKVNKGIDKDLQ